jgi:hypothetical protein
MIDIRTRPERFSHALVEAQRSRPPRAVLVARIPDDADVDGGFAYVNGVPLTTDPGVVPPSKPKPPPPKEDPAVVLARAKARRVDDIREELWAHVDEHIDPREQTALQALFSKATLLLVGGIPVDDEAFQALTLALGWCEAHMGAHQVARGQVEAARDLEAVAAVVVDLAAFGEAPAITAGDIAARLQGAP